MSDPTDTPSTDGAPDPEEVRIESWGQCGRCHEHRRLVAHGAMCQPCLDALLVLRTQRMHAELIDHLVVHDAALAERIVDLEAENAALRNGSASQYQRLATEETRKRLAAEAENERLTERLSDSWYVDVGGRLAAADELARSVLRHESGTHERGADPAAPYSATVKMWAAARAYLGEDK